MRRRSAAQAGTGLPGADARRKWLRSSRGSRRTNGATTPATLQDELAGVEVSDGLILVVPAEVAVVRIALSQLLHCEDALDNAFGGSNVARIEQDADVPEAGVRLVAVGAKRIANKVKRTVEAIRGLRGQ